MESNYQDDNCSINITLLSEKAKLYLSKKMDKPSIWAIQWFYSVQNNFEQKELIKYYLKKKLELIYKKSGPVMSGFRYSTGLLFKEQNYLYEEILTFLIECFMLTSYIEKRPMHMLVDSVFNYLCVYFNNYANYIKEAIYNIVDVDEQIFI